MSNRNAPVAGSKYISVSKFNTVCTSPAPADVAGDCFCDLLLAFISMFFFLHHVLYACAYLDLPPAHAASSSRPLGHPPALLVFWLWLG